MNQDTIAAIATGLTNAGISIIRISGSESFSIILSIFKIGKLPGRALSSEEILPNTFRFGHIFENDEAIDEVICLFFKGPSSYTAEDVVEIHCHGGITGTKKVLQVVLDKGARIAEPGEFTKRAFLNGRIDLSQAEAVSNMISSKNSLAMKNSMRLLAGFEFDKITEIRNEMIKKTAFIEAALDDPEHYSLDGFSDELSECINNWNIVLKGLIGSFERGRLIQEGIRTAIIGKPNAGKSTLLNALIGEERAIVTDIAGTTRDTIEETVSLSGVTLNLLDTAGIREASDEIEKIGVERAMKALNEADLVLYVVDASVSPDDEDKALFELIREKKSIVLLNKSDLGNILGEEDFTAHNLPVVLVSAKRGDGLDELNKEILNMFFEGGVMPNDEIYITSARHLAALKRSIEALSNVQASIEMMMTEDFFTIDLMNAYSSLGEIIGEETDEDLINTIFKEFCMGK